jgi:hypothetical protein
MSGFSKLLNKVNKYDVNKILFEVWKNPKVRLFIEDLNTEKQLHDKGVDSLGVTLGQYSAYTKQIKLNKGQSIKHITLKDTGEFYESFDVKPNQKGFTIFADAQKEDTNLIEAYGKDILGLTDESIKLLIEFIKPYYIEASKKAIL